MPNLLVTSYAIPPVSTAALTKARIIADILGRWRRPVTCIAIAAALNEQDLGANELVKKESARYVFAMHTSTTNVFCPAESTGIRSPSSASHRTSLCPKPAQDAQQPAEEAPKEEEPKEKEKVDKEEEPKGEYVRSARNASPSRLHAAEHHFQESRRRCTWDRDTRARIVSTRLCRFYSFCADRNNRRLDDSSCLYSHGLHDALLRNLRRAEALLKAALGRVEAAMKKTSVRMGSSRMNLRSTFDLDASDEQPISAPGDSGADAS
ncbi:hypothetical protein MSAN_01309900 [Mycena sanguinolenta]|uniref:C3H1-type domain-containing protein n=1 Tax=Mycena sanguinolenta TaxID=230812 RepID=A0A8H6YA06_9AGAR|nr:hypothetical protein MSAN_01309900 [Mycena sanguinolenta]